MLVYSIWAILGLFLFISGFRQIRLRRHILALPTSKARSLAMGTVELSGCVRQFAPLVDPIFSQPCAYYNIEVKERRGSGKNSRWVTIYHQTTESTPFLLEDSTGCVFVLPRLAELHFSNRIFKQSSALGRWIRNEEPVTRFLTNLGNGVRSLQLVAYIFRQGDPLYVLGHASTNISAAAPGRKVEMRDIARDLKNNSEKMKVLDLNKDGVVDSQEWEAGLKREVERQQSSTAGSSGAIPLPVIQKGGSEQFVLADSEKNLLSKFAWTSWLQIVLGGGSVVACVVALLKKF